MEEMDLAMEQLMPLLVVGGGGGGEEQTIQ